VNPPGHGAALAAFCDRLGYQFHDQALLRRAVAHRSWCAEHPEDPSNERLEFLGDAVLGWVVADLVYRRHHDQPEGKLTDLRKRVVNASALADLAVQLDLGSVILLGKGETAAGGASKPSILSDAFEAVLGAVYLDGGVVAVSGLIERIFADILQEAADSVDRADHKTALQELTARRFDVAPVYVISHSGPDHAREFTASVLVGGEIVGSGSGPSKKLAEQRAAEEARRALESRLHGES
jgi:ribonuclease-3